MFPAQGAKASERALPHGHSQSWPLRALVRSARALCHADFKYCIRNYPLVSRHCSLRKELCSPLIFHREYNRLNQYVSHVKEVMMEAMMEIMMEVMEVMEAQGSSLNFRGSAGEVQIPKPCIFPPTGTHFSMIRKPSDNKQV